MLLPVGLTQSAERPYEQNQDFPGREEILPQNYRIRSLDPTQGFSVFQERKKKKKDYCDLCQTQTISGFFPRSLIGLTKGFVTSSRKKPNESFGQHNSLAS